MKVVNLKHQSATAQLIVWGDKGREGSATFASLYSSKRSRGHASALMDQMVAYADAHDLLVMLDAKPFGPRIRSAMTPTQLIDFYGRYGFVVRETTKCGTFMVRQPRPKE